MPPGRFEQGTPRLVRCHPGLRSGGVAPRHVRRQGYSRSTTGGGAPALRACGDLELTGDALELLGDDLTMIVYTAPLGGPDQEKLDFLARWAGKPNLQASAQPVVDASDL